MTRMNRDDVLRLVREARERGERPNLVGANLRDADLYGADLYGANLVDADLRDADLRDADLRHVNLRGANLLGAYLYGVNLRGVNLRGANLRVADLWGADLWGADLRGANLHGAALHGANLCDARWDGLVIDGLHPCRILLTPTADGWEVNIGCWSGTPDELQDLIDGDDWPDAVGVEITRRRPLLEAALLVVDAHIAAHPDVINDLKERWQA